MARLLWLWPFIYIECNLSDISVSKVCQEFLSSKAASLGKTANKAVHDVDLESDDHNSDEDDSDKEHNDSDDESSEDLEGESVLNEGTNIQIIENLIPSTLFISRVHCDECYMPNTPVIS